MKKYYNAILGLAIVSVISVSFMVFFSIVTGIVVWAIGNDETSGEVITGENYVIREAMLEIGSPSAGRTFNYNMDLPYWKIQVDQFNVNCPEEIYIGQLANADEIKQKTAKFFSGVMKEEVKVLDYYLDYCWWEENQEYKIEGVFLVGSTPYIFEMSE